VFFDFNMFNPTGSWSMKFIVIAISSVVLFFPAFWLFSQVVGDDWGAGIAAVAMYIAFPILMLKIWPDSKKPKTDTMFEALENGVLASAEYEVRDVVEIEEVEDEGCHYLLDIGDGQTLVLSGQYLYGPVESGMFPSSRIRIFWHRTEGYTFGIECLGNNILPSKSINSIAEDGNGNMSVPSDRDVLDQPLGKVVALMEARV